MHRDIDPRDRHLQGIGSRAGVDPLEVSLRDDLCHDGELLQQAGGLRPRHDDPRERIVMCDGVSWAG